MFVFHDRRLLYGLLVPGTAIVIGGLIWYHNRRKNEQIRLNRSEYLVLEIQVPAYCVGSIIGKGGEAIKRFQQQFSVRCAFAKDDEKLLKENYRILIMRGQRHHVYEAEVEMRRLIADLPQYQQIEMFIPDHACGYLIGKNGSHIKDIRDSSKARLSLDRKIIDNLENKRFSRLIISGTSEQISAAKTLVEERLYRLEQKKKGYDNHSVISTKIFIRERPHIILHVEVSCKMRSSLFVHMLDSTRIHLDLDLDQFHDHLNGSSIGADDGDSQDVDMTVNSRQHNGQNQAEKRAHHNALERKRRDHIKGSFSDLRDVIPSLKGEKASRAHVLKAATDYIRNMKTKTQHHQKTIEELKRQNAIVELQIRLLERVKETGQYTRHITNHHQHQQQEQLVKIELNEIQTTRNLLTHENNPSISSHI
ncbi:unnamed protein product [Rotaria magnacalcarata]|uniref:BHLH domain-containing protein n=3 Tax=Rotaria magnacalcarata TaxID=392030 RepID=A0A8S2LRT5_9BILA|nr:unnamed protein product [Rotaria magnacalcarata]CAF3920504.1 unnamed protein product [Rotaria magnacalcarata]